MRKVKKISVQGLKQGIVKHILEVTSLFHKNTFEE